MRGLVNGNSANWVGDDNVVLTGRIVGVNAQRIVGVMLSDVGVAELAVLARVPVAPMPLLAECFNLDGVLGHARQSRPRRTGRGKHQHNADAGDDGNQVSSLWLSGS